MFLGRENELKELNRLYGNKGFQFIIIYGRRRVGKTALIAEFVKDKEHVFYISIERNDKEALADFSAQILNYFPLAKSMLDVFPSWDKAFAYIAEQAGKQSFILAIDEYPYLASGNPSISSILQKYIDTSFQSTNMTLILCGSSMNFMKNQVLGYKSPLYGRRTAQLEITPFDYYDAGSFFPQASLTDKMLAYAVCGGIPQYLNAVAQHGSVQEGIYECFFKKSGALYEEPENLLKQELREPAVYNTLIASIAGGSSKLNDISTKTGEENKKCAKYLKSLMDLQIIHREQPHGIKKERNGIYALSDNMFRFWYRFIPKNVTGIEMGLGKQVLAERVMPEITAHTGRVFEDACRDYMKRMNKNQCLPFTFYDIGRWWGTNVNTKSQEEIDFIADADEKAIFGECKWQNAEVRLDVLQNLQRKSAIFSGYTDKHYFIFSKSGFHGLLKGDSADGHVHLVDLGMMYGGGDGLQ